MAVLCMECRSKKIKEVVQDNLRYFYCESCKKLHPRAFDTQKGSDIIVNTAEGPYHITAGALIKKQTHYLLLKRRTFPFGYDFPGGHIEYGENPQEAMEREILEETGLKVKNPQLIFHGAIHGNKCRYGVDTHIQYFFECEYDEGTPFFNPESEGIGWYSLEEMGKLNLVSGAEYLLKHAVIK